MADDGFNAIMVDLQKHLQTARVQVTNLSSIAKHGDDALVEKFMSESVFVTPPGASRAQLAEDKADILQSQLYIACFWGFRDVVRGIVELSQQQDLNVNISSQNKGTLWTPLHAATFQEHGPIVMMLLSWGAKAELKDYEGRSPKDFASASDKIWGHFAAQGMKRTPRSTLVELGIIKKSLVDGDNASQRKQSPRTPGTGIRMAAYSSPEMQVDNDPFGAASTSGDVLANDDEAMKTNQPPQFAIYK